MPSYTYAIKGAKLLNARGYPCEIKRTEKATGGCGYSIHINSSCSDALSLLDRYKIPYRLITDGGET